MPLMRQYSTVGRVEREWEWEMISRKQAMVGLEPGSPAPG